MSAQIERFPHLDQFVNGYLHQDWRLFGPTLEAVVETYADDTSCEDMTALGREIGEFVNSGGAGMYSKWFPDAVSPAGWRMSPEHWLRHLADLAWQQAHKHGSRSGI